MTEQPVLCPLRIGALRPEAGGAAVFLDRDGVLIADTGYPSDPGSLELLPGVGSALRRLRGSGWMLVVTSNQSGVARGLFDMGRLREMHTRLEELLAAEEVALTAAYYCPHHPAGEVPAFTRVCDCRKPAPGMLRAAISTLQLRPSRCWMIGDQPSDAAAAQAVGVRALWLGGPAGDPQTEFDIEMAVNRILGD